MKKAQPPRRISRAKPRRDVVALTARLQELEETLSAIRSGAVDALIVSGSNGPQVYTIKGAEAPYRAFIEQMNEGAVTLSSDGTILYCNKHFADMLDMPLERIIGANILPYVHAAARETAARVVRDAGTATVTLAPRKGTPLPVRFSVNSLHPDDAQTRCLVVTDLTEQYERQMLAGALETLKTSQAELQKQYQEVQAVRAALEQANAAKDEFLAALSHELRTPLTPVLLTANAMTVDPSLPRELRNDMEMIRRNVELEARLIDDLLDLTRITRGKLQITPKPVDLHETLRLALDICHAGNAAKGLRFVTRLDATHHHVAGEPVRLQQIFWNLIRNAVKFTPGQGVITVSSRNATKSQEIIVEVSDTGIGMSRDIMARIFNAFEQGSGDITRRFGGLGLGLTISKRLVELHGGRIDVVSRGLNKGSTFTITLPTVAAPATLASGRAPSQELRPQSLRILLVEDHDDTRRNMTRLLTALNHHVVPAQDVASARARASEEPFDLVISDIGLPDESGLELMKSLRERHGLRGICLSGYGMEEDIAKSLAAGFVEHLTKPINLERLEAAIVKLSDRRR